MRRFLVFIFLVTASRLMFAQNYVPFPTDSARWKCTVLSGAFGCPNLVAEFQDELKGDTLINSVLYHKVIRTGYSNNSFCYYVQDGYTGAIREDSNKHVFLRTPNATSDTLLYDFGLQVGDTLRSYANCCGPLVVSSIDSILIQSSYRKRFILDAANSSGCFVSGLQIIEGIGSEHGLMECFSTFETGAHLDCFTLHGQTIYPDTTTNCPVLIEDIPTMETEMCSIVVLVGNDLSSVSISPGNNACGYRNAEIFDGLGRKVYSSQINSNEPISISREIIGAGIFFARFENEKGEATTVKFVFQ